MQQAGIIGSLIAETQANAEISRLFGEAFALSARICPHAEMQGATGGLSRGALLRASGGSVKSRALR
jgi:hypothetical protein